MSRRTGSLVEWNGGARMFWPVLDDRWFAWPDPKTLLLVRRRSRGRGGVRRNGRRLGREEAGRPAPECRSR